MTPSKLLSSLTILLVISTALLSSCKQPSSAQLGWQLVYRNGPNGETLAGNKADLLEAVRNGYPIRMGWGIRRTSDTTKSVEHVADAIFMTIANGTGFGLVAGIWTENGARQMRLAKRLRAGQVFVNNYGAAAGRGWLDAPPSGRRSKFHMSSRHSSGPAPGRVRIKPYHPAKTLKTEFGKM